MFSLGGSSQPKSSQTFSSKGKEKARPKFEVTVEEEEDEACNAEGLWVDMYDPLTEVRGPFFLVKPSYATCIPE